MSDVLVTTSSETETRLSHETVNALGQRLRGALLREGEPAYDEARQVWNGMIDKRPAMIARCTGTADVIDAVKAARANDLLVSVRGGGHNVAGKAVCEGGLVIDLSQMKGVRVDPEARTARIQPGVTLGDFDRETQAFGLATPTGIVSMTGMAGLTLGGGFGWLSRPYGLTCDNLLSAEVVTADGRFLRASETEHPDLFWGLRGGGGNFGVVTSFEYRLHEVGPEVVAGLAIWPLAQAADVLRFYRDFAASAPDELGTMAVLRIAPPAPFLPEEVHGTPIVGIGVCYAGAVEEGRRLVEPVKSFGDPVGDVIGPTPYRAHQCIFDAGQQPGNQYYWKSEYLAGLDDAAVETCIGYAERLTSPLTGILISQLGGAISRVGEQETAFSHRDAAFVLNINTGWEDPGETDRHVQWAYDFWRAMQPHGTGGVYVNFISADEGEARVRAAYGPATYERLVDVKRTYDPTNRFRVNQNIDPA